MKTILSMLLFLTFSLGVSAQRKVNSDEHNEKSNDRNEYSHEYHSRIYTVPLISYRLGYDYPYYGNPFYGYPYYGYGYPYYSYPLWYRTPYDKNRVMPYKLSLQIQSIKMDYKNKLREARNDKSLSHLQRQQKILSLKTERDQSIINAQKNFIQQGNGNSNNPDNGNTSS